MNLHNSNHLVSWMAGNKVAANLLMILLVIAGLYSLSHIRYEIQPNYTYSTILIDVAYPSADPLEVENGIILAVEKKLAQIEGLTKVTGVAFAGYAQIRADIAQGESLDRVLMRTKTAIDNITTFPDGAEPPIVRLDDDARWLTTIALTTSNNTEDLHTLAKSVKQDLLAIDGIIQVKPRVEQNEEIQIRFPFATLQALNLSLSDVAEQVSNIATTQPSGVIHSNTGEVQLKTDGRSVSQVHFANIPIRTPSPGENTVLGDVANISEGLSNQKSFFSLNGQQGLLLYVYQARDAQTLPLAEDVKTYVDTLQSSLPDSIKVSLPYKRTERFSQRLSSLLSNGLTGLMLVAMLLGAFLTPRLAMWVGLSIPVVLIGTFSFLLYLDVSINMISMFAFIMTIGLVVDDAIIVGENIYAKYQSGMNISQAASEGAREMMLPVSIAIITNIMAFMPILMMEGNMGQYMRSLPIVAIVVFAVSFFDALFLLPAHLNSSHKRSKQTRPSESLFAGGLIRFRDRFYIPLLSRSLQHKYSILIVFFGLLWLAFSWFESGRTDFRWFPLVPSDNVSAYLTMPVDSSFASTVKTSQFIEEAGLAAVAEIGSTEDVISHAVTAGMGSANKVKVTITLNDESKRTFSQQEFANLWREKVGDLPQARALQFDYLVGFGRSGGVYLEVSHYNDEILAQAAQQLADSLATFDGLFDVSNGLDEGKQSLIFTLTNEARTLGFTETDLGLQLKDAFFGKEAFRFMRNGQLVKVWVRLNEEEKGSLEFLGRFIVTAPDGTRIPLSQAANFHYSHIPPQITRENGKKTLKVGGLLNPSTGNLTLIKKVLDETIIPDLRAQYPGLKLGYPGTLSKSQSVSPLQTLINGFIIASVSMFILVSSLFRSTIQGAIILLTIPFSLAAALFGHIVMGFAITSNSLFGMVALSGLVINSALVLTSKVNYSLAQGQHFSQAIIEASSSRFRAIILTSATTTIGLLPMLMETTEQALFLVPFAIALTFGTAMSTVVVLFLVPCFHAIHHELSLMFRSQNTITES
ncbi:efflux RND transporter permease subunit [Lacimicrobium sp. SS2-24]|uniref:efflux RND transporter permease subunit n=1 Tax=Lacimicrobium sp. SS2-24 TaxID=2005569 RepID=UPI000B4AD259|nr:efflux RND transporter permease subunit [Lacimicrobium sp. SS2-24]